MIDISAITKMMNDPEMKRIMEMCNGKDPKEVFFEECKRKNVDPESILSQLRGSNTNNTFK